MAKQVKEVNPKALEPTFMQQYTAALFVAALGAENVGVGTASRVTWPYYVTRPHLVAKEAAELIISVHTALLEALPPQDLERISKEWRQRLDDQFEGLPHSDACRSLEELRRLSQVGAASCDESGCCRHCRLRS